MTPFRISQRAAIVFLLASREAGNEARHPRSGIPSVAAEARQAAHSDFKLPPRDHGAERGVGIKAEPRHAHFPLRSERLARSNRPLLPDPNIAIKSTVVFVSCLLSAEIGKPVPCPKGVLSLHDCEPEAASPFFEFLTELEIVLGHSPCAPMPDNVEQTGDVVAAHAKFFRIYVLQHEGCEAEFPKTPENPRYQIEIVPAVQVSYELRSPFGHPFLQLATVRLRPVADERQGVVEDRHDVARRQEPARPHFLEPVFKSGEPRRKPVVVLFLEGLGKQLKVFSQV